ncbi:hypothetical protein DFH06DRAFT_1148311 [Mycena polygramma]|nr:hypothetical protein DFH06DRAFT_1148311 [Mycena polygramma]
MNYDCTKTHGISRRWLGAGANPEGFHNQNQCMGNIHSHRKIAHDPATYVDPMAFNPNRFLAADGKVPEPDPGRFCFGHGRRKFNGGRHRLHGVQRVSFRLQYGTPGRSYRGASVGADVVGREVGPIISLSSLLSSHVLDFVAILSLLNVNARALELIHGG